MTVGTGYAGRSSVGENLRPDHLVNWVRLAYNADAKVPMGDFSGLSPWTASSGPVPPYPAPSNTTTVATDPARERETDVGGDLREELRRIIIEELHDLIGGDRRG
jgi:hypothetical protein